MTTTQTKKENLRERLMKMTCRPTVIRVKVEHETKTKTKTEPITKKETKDEMTDEDDVKDITSEREALKGKTFLISEKKTNGCCEPMSECKQTWDATIDTKTNKLAAQLHTLCTMIADVNYQNNVADVWVYGSARDTVLTPANLKDEYPKMLTAQASSAIRQALDMIYGVDKSIKLDQILQKDVWLNALAGIVREIILRSRRHRGGPKAFTSNSNVHSFESATNQTIELHLQAFRLYKGSR